MAKYKVKYEGFAYVEADSHEEAEELFEDDDYTYKERHVTSVEKVEEFLVEI